MSHVYRVLFVVDRIALTRQASENYQAYDPDGDIADVAQSGVVKSTHTTTDLSRKLKSRGNDIIVTSVQKLDTLIKRKYFQAPDNNIVFIVD